MAFSKTRWVKGSSHDTEWNKELLWKGFCEREGKLMGQELPTTADKSDYRTMPPHARALAKTLQKSPVGKARMKRLNDHEKRVTAEFRASYRPQEIPKPVMIGFGRRKLSEAGSIGTESSGLPSSRPSTGRSIVSNVPRTPSSTARTDDRLRYLEEKLRVFESKSQTAEETISKQQHKLAEYKSILTRLVEAVETAQKRR